MDLIRRRARDCRKRIAKRKVAKRKADKNARGKRRKLERRAKDEQKERAVGNLFKALQTQLGAAHQKQIS